MCGRFTLTGSLIWLIRLLGLPELPLFADRYNIAPSQPLLTFLYDIDKGTMTHDFLTWGFIPSFVKVPQSSSIINARCETLRSKAAFKNALRYRRCIIPASGFYEWQKDGSKKIPWYFSAENGSHLYMAGIWEIWHGEGGEQVHSCAVITTAAIGRISEIHSRMPLFITEDKIFEWLAPETEEWQIDDIIASRPKVLLQSWRVSPSVNSVRNDSPSCIEPFNISQPSLW